MISPARPSLAFLCVLLSASPFLPAPASAATLTVSTTADSVNGDVSSPAALVANPGPDGISLREAILATNNAPGPHTITFASALAGQSIVLVQSLPLISQDNVTLTGLTTSDGQPNITIDAHQVAATLGVVFVTASYFDMRGLRIVGVAQNNALLIRAGQTGFFGAAPQRVTNIRIERNVFSNPGFTSEPTTAIEVGTEPSCAGATIRNVVIANNSIDRFGGNQQWGDGILLRAGGNDCLVEDIVIDGNTFSQVVLPVELATNPGAGSRIRRTRIVHNVFTNSYASVSLNPVGDVGPVSGSVVDDTLIERNVFNLNLDTAFGIHGGVGNATGNVVANTRIVNNLIVRGACPSCPVGPGGPADGTDRGGGFYIADNDPPATNNQVNGVSIVNNTIVRQGPAGQPAIQVVSSGGVTGLTVLNTILWGNSSADLQGVTPGQVRFSITSQPGFAGTNGNISADPKFVNPAAGDYHLQAGSPAIDAGTSDGAPSRDLECRSRVDDPARPNTGGGASPFFDIGAYEFGGGPPDCSSVLTVTKAGTGAGTVTSSPPGIDCGAACAASFPSGTEVSLTATASPGSLFSGWSGSCTGSDACKVTVVADTNVGATFAAAFTLAVTRAGTGSGTVSSSPTGIACGSSCSALFASGTTVTLTATPAAGSNFAGWSGGGCSGTGPCVATVIKSTVVTATFVPVGQVGLSVLLAGTGSGTVTSSPAGINCGTTCLGIYASGTTVTLTATAATNSAFPGWSGGGCSGAGPCVVTLTGNTSVTAAFIQTSATVSVTTTGSAGGSVTSSPAGITCGTACSATFPLNSLVTLTATPAAGASFKGWSGACSGASPTCTLTVSGAVSVTATFSKVLSDDPLAAASTLIKALHVTELRAAIDTLRARKGLSPFNYTDATLTPGGSVVKRAHLVDLRNALTQAYQAAELTIPTFTDATITAGVTVIKAVHLNELRSAVRAIE